MAQKNHRVYSPDAPLETVRLEHVNAAPAQTWNWLKINETELAVSVPETLVPQFVEPVLLAQAFDTEVPAEAQGLVMGAGTQATAWMDLCATERRVIRIDKETTEKEVYITVAADQIDQTTIVVDDDVKADICVVLAPSSDMGGPITDHFLQPHTTASALRIVVGKGAHVVYKLAMLGNDKVACVQSLGVRLARDARFTMKQFLLGGSKTCSGVGVELTGDRAHIESLVRYVGQRDDFLDISQNIIHHGKKTMSNIEATGVLSENAHKVLRATIDLSRGCKGAEGTETETVLLAGDEATNKTLPVILCSEDDVAGNHGATIGSLSEDQLFYLASHGLDKEEAHDLFAESVITDALNQLPEKAAELVQA